LARSRLTGAVCCYSCSGMRAGRRISCRWGSGLHGGRINQRGLAANGSRPFFPSGHIRTGGDSCIPGAPWCTRRTLSPPAASESGRPRPRATIYRRALHASRKSFFGEGPAKRRVEPFGIARTLSCISFRRHRVRVIGDEGPMQWRRSCRCPAQVVRVQQRLVHGSLVRDTGRRRAADCHGAQRTSAAKVGKSRR